MGEFPDVVLALASFEVAGWGKEGCICLVGFLACKAIRLGERLEFLNTKGVLLQNHFVILHLLVEFATRTIRTHFLLYNSPEKLCKYYSKRVKCNYSAPL